MGPLSFPDFQSVNQSYKRDTKMTVHGEYNEDLTLHGLEPGEDNPLEHEPRYNPLRYCYPMIAIVDEIHYELAVKFQLQEHGETTPIDFIDPKTGTAHSVNFFPKMPDIALEPDWDGPEPDLESGYQIGEAPYYLVPIICRCKRLRSSAQETSRLLSREAANKLITPGVLQAAIIAFRDKVENDPAAPARLCELLDMWDPDKEYLYDSSEEDPWGYDEDDDEVQAMSHYVEDTLGRPFEFRDEHEEDEEDDDEDDD